MPKCWSNQRENCNRKQYPDKWDYPGNGQIRTDQMRSINISPGRSHDFHWYYQKKEKNHPPEKKFWNHHMQTCYFFININMCSKSFHQKTVVAASAVIFKRNPGVIPRVRTITANNPIRPSTNTPDTGCRTSFSSCIYIFTMSRR